MILTRGKIVIISIAVAILIGLLGLVQFATIESEELEELVTLSLEDVKVETIDEEENVMTIQVDFTVFNTAEKTLTISKIDYELFANERSLDMGFLSFEDMPLGGRPPLFPSSNATIPSEFRLRYSEDVKDVWDQIASDDEGNQISWRVKGTAEIESAFSIALVSFESSI